MRLSPLSLFPWQEPYAEQVRRVLATGDLAIITMGTGTGKTYISLDTLKRLNLRALVIAPKVSLTNWQRVAYSMEATEHLAGVINPERISLGRCPWYNGSTWTLDGINAVIWDEFHKGASGYDSKATLAASRLKTLPVKKIIMSATIADSPIKMRALGYLLNLHNFDEPVYRNWAARNGCYWDTTGPRPVFRFTRNEQMGRGYMLRIHNQIADRLIGCRIEDIPDFPTSLIEVKLYDLDKVSTDAVRAAYADMSERMQSNGVLPLTVRLRARERIEFSKCALLSDLVVDYVEENKSVVVFLNFRSGLSRLGDFLSKKGIAFSTIHGDQKDTERQNHIDRFQRNEVFVMLAMTQAGGVSVSLHDEQHVRPRVSLLTPGDNAAEIKQALGRVWRANGTHSTQQFVLAADTTEEKVYRSFQRKQIYIQTLQDGDLDALAV